MSSNAPKFKVNSLNRALGYIKFYDGKGGFGFITNDPEAYHNPGVSDRNSDVFFHVEEFKKKITIVPGKLVEFRLVKGPKGWQAWDCVLIDYLNQSAPQD